MEPDVPCIRAIEALIRIVKATSPSLLFLRNTCELVAGVWLAILGEWSIIGLGVIFWFFSNKALGYALIPSLAFSIPASRCLLRGNATAFLYLGAMSSVYVHGLTAIWCCCIVFGFMKIGAPNSLVPILIWSFGVACEPWVYIARQEFESSQSDESLLMKSFVSMIAVYLTQVGFILMCFLIVLMSTTFLQSLFVIFSFMSIAITVQMLFAIAIVRSRKSENTDL